MIKKSTQVRSKNNIVSIEYYIADPKLIKKYSIKQTLDLKSELRKREKSTKKLMKLIEINSAQERSYHGSESVGNAFSY